MFALPEQAGGEKKGGFGGSQLFFREEFPGVWYSTLTGRKKHRQQRTLVHGEDVGSSPAGIRGCHSETVHHSAPKNVPCLRFRPLRLMGVTPGSQPGDASSTLAGVTTRFPRSRDLKKSVPVQSRRERQVRLGSESQQRIRRLIVTAQWARIIQTGTPGKSTGSKFYLLAPFFFTKQC